MTTTTNLAQWGWAAIGLAASVSFILSVVVLN